ncbi:MAG: nucleoside triphosphate pyrophosphohydrolase [Rhodomicrobium sp.]
MSCERKSKPTSGNPHTSADGSAASELERLLDIMARLRDPEHGCPWDREQTFATIAPYTIEEAYEVAEAIGRGDMDDLKDELGDLLLQVVYHARMAEEAGHFAFAGVAEAICSKMIRRHPHVFAEEKTGAAPGQWEAIKQAERNEKVANAGTGLFDGIPAGLPPLLRSAKLQRRARSTGFDWPSVEPILDKVDEELAELRAEIAAPAGPAKDKRQFEEFGDLMFVLVNLGMRLGIDAESALRAANSKFVRRMEVLEAGAKASGRELKDMTLDEMQVFWDRAKAAEREAGE